MQDTDSEEDILDEGDGDDDVEEEHDNGAEVLVHPELAVKKSPEVSVAPKEAERQLSKKERKKKELAELDALLADFGVTPKENDGQDESSGNWNNYFVLNIVMILFNLFLDRIFLNSLVVKPAGFYMQAIFIAWCETT